MGPLDADKADALSTAQIEAASDDVFFAGWRDDVAEVMAISDVFVLASWREGMPRSAIEAAASGLPSVLTDIRGCREVVRDGIEGRLVPPRSPEPLGEAILQLVQDRDTRERMGRAARARAEQRFDERRVVSTVVDVTDRPDRPSSPRSIDVSGPRVLVIGLDGAEPSSIQYWAETGVMRFVRELMQDGASGVLRSTVPPYTPTAWTSIITGVNPGRHGVFGFTRWTDDGREVLVDSSLCRCKTVWDYLTDEGRPSIVVNVPITYPPRRIRGVLVSGMGTPKDATVFASSSDWQARLEEIVPDYVPDVSVGDGATTSERKAMETVGEIERALRQRLILTERLLATEPWEFAMVVLEAPDRLQHLFWKKLEPASPASSEKDRILRVYRELDEGMRRLVRTAEQDGPVVVVVVSDHGFQALDWNVFINNLLIRNGLLTLKPGVTVARLARTLPTPIRRLASRVAGRLKPGGTVSAAEEIDWSRTKAFSGRVFEQGVYVKAGSDNEGAAIAEVRSVLESMRGPDGQPVVSDIVGREDVYWGPCVGNAPALFPMLDLPGVMMAGTLSHHGLWEAQPGPFGTHHADGVILAAGPGITRTDELNADAHDVAPTLLRLLGGPLPAGMDGRPIDKIGGASVKEIAISVERQAAELSGYTAEEEEEIVAHLQGLGYFE